MDIFSPEKRSEIMSKIRSKDTKSELRLRKALFSEGIRGYRLQKRVYGIRPDILFMGRKIAIFIDGCFWHKCPECFRMPKSRIDYWAPKIDMNAARDLRNTLTLEQEGWKVLRFWEHAIRDNLCDVVEEIKGHLRNH